MVRLHIGAAYNRFRIRQVLRCTSRARATWPIPPDQSDLTPHPLPSLKLVSLIAGGGDRLSPD